MKAIYKLMNEIDVDLKKYEIVELEIFEKNRMKNRMKKKLLKQKSSVQTDASNRGTHYDSGKNEKN